jgi:N-methylhydantoinase A/oxoprolinase/acetone carboxylase beta subunit
MTIALGIDTGGTYTDAVLVDHQTGNVLAGAKALTTHHDLSAGIKEAVTKVLTENECDISPGAVELVGLSTTLATNAIVEGQGCPVCLLLIGYDPELLRQYGFEYDLVTQDVVYINGGHNVEGEEVAPLDEMAAKEAILSRRGQVDAFAISGYFGVRNPSHELRVRTMVEEFTRGTNGFSMPVTCGHELTTHLDSVKRATTAALNARLIPLLRELITTVRQSLDTLEIGAPLMIVKGDGSLVRTEWAMRRPIETILSGPAASVVGAWHLAGRQDVWVIDVGGTTSDIAILQGGHPRLNPEGAQVGRWQTMVEAVDIHTVGLGGDSQVRLNERNFLEPGKITVGPRRIMPLCLLASQYPQIVHELRKQGAQKQRMILAGKFAVAQRQTSHTLSEKDAALLELLHAGPQAFVSFTLDPRFKFSFLEQIEMLSAKRLILQAGFTPTDALHVLGQFKRWDVEASRLGAELLATQLKLSPEELCVQVISAVSDRIAAELVSKILSKETTFPNWEREPAAVALLTRAFDGSHCNELDCRLTLKHPIIAIGAPVKAYLPRTTQHLNTELCIPDYAEVANAVGAVAGGVVQRVRVLIHHLESLSRSVFRTYLPDGNRDFPVLENAVAYAEDVVSARLETLTREAGADHVEVNMTREDHIVSDIEGTDEGIYLSTELHFTAIGRPSLARE